MSILRPSPDYPIAPRSRRALAEWHCATIAKALRFAASQRRVESLEAVELAEFFEGLRGAFVKGLGRTV